MEVKNPGKKEKARRTNLPAAAAVPAKDVATRLLTDDLIVEIPSRLPVRSVHRFKCVSPSWRDLIAEPAHRKKLPQTIAGFLYNTYNRINSRFHDFHFASVTAGAAPPVDPSLPFLPPNQYLHVCQIDTCNGLLLCLAYMVPSSSADEERQLESHYVVCNPATERWVDLPAHPKVSLGVSGRTLARLAFDPAASSHFHVLQFDKTDQEDYITGVDIYSSQAGAWNRRESRLDEKFNLYFGLTSVFFHGMLDLLGWLHPMNVDQDNVMVAVDMEGQVWKTIRVPLGGMSFGTIGLSQGCLHYATTNLVVADKNKKKKKKKRKEGDASLATKIASAGV